MAPGRRREALIARMSVFFETGLPNQVLRFDRVCAAVYGEIRYGREAVGRQTGVEDAMIAATARAYGMQSIITRNIKDFAECGVALVDPWARGRPHRLRCRSLTGGLARSRRRWAHLWNSEFHAPSAASNRKPD
jgi:hypothetical protein